MSQVLDRRPGQFASERFRARRRAWLKRVWWVLPLAAGLELGACLAIGLIFQPGQLSFYGGVGLGLALATVMILADAPPHHIERWREGADGEKATAKALRPLFRAGWVVVHDVDRGHGRGNVDHILVGPAGIFVLDSKRLRGLCSVEGGVLSVRCREDPDDVYARDRLAPRAKATAAELRRKLQDEVSVRLWVQPVIVLWANFEQRSILSGGVAWISGRHLAATLEKRPVQLTPREVQSVVDALRTS